MKKIIGGALAVILGLIGFSLNPWAFFKFILGSVPFLLLVSGALAVYLGYDSRTDEEDSGASGVQAEGTTFLGNTDTLVFHREDCNFSQSKKCTARFGSRDEAVSQGYKPCGICTP